MVAGSVPGVKRAVGRWVPADHRAIERTEEPRASHPDRVSSVAPITR